MNSKFVSTLVLAVLCPLFLAQSFGDSPLSLDEQIRHARATYMRLLETKFGEIGADLNNFSWNQIPARSKVYIKRELSFNKSAKIKSAQSRWGDIAYCTVELKEPKTLPFVVTIQELTFVENFVDAPDFKYGMRWATESGNTLDVDCGPSWLGYVFSNEVGLLFSKIRYFPELEGKKLRPDFDG